MIRMLDVFAGIGGFSLAARWTGCVETVGFCELDPWCQRVLAKNFPGVPIHDDIKTLTGDALARFGRIDVITGGFPCQPYSVAGKRGGAADDRALWPAMAAVITESRPTYVLAENVPGIVSMELDVCLADLEALGYACRAVVVPAIGVDAPHRRERVWILAHAGGGGRGEPLRVDAASGALPATVWQEGASGAGSGGANVSHAAGQRCTRPWKYEQSIDPAKGRSSQATKPVDGDKGSAWPDEPRVGRVVDGLPSELDKHRLRGLGNAIVPQVAYELMRVMFADEMEQAA